MIKADRYTPCSLHQINILQFGRIFAEARSNLDYEDFYCPCPLVPFAGGVLALGAYHVISFSARVAAAAAVPDCRANDWLGL